jgi:hypothetical protein
MLLELEPGAEPPNKSLAFGFSLRIISPSFHVPAGGNFDPHHESFFPFLLLIKTAGILFDPESKKPMDGPGSRIGSAGA